MLVICGAPQALSFTKRDLITHTFQRQPLTPSIIDTMKTCDQKFETPIVNSTDYLFSNGSYSSEWSEDSVD